MKPKSTLKFLGFVVTCAVFALLVVGKPAVASTTDGTIDATQKYAWGDHVGWVNFGTSGGNVHITDTAVTGYAWSENYGWINLSPTQSGVTNNAEGVLSGYAWGEKLGWIYFNGVTISNSGVFAGVAAVSSTPKGSISFDCANCVVKTDWRPASVRGGGGGGGGSSGGGTVYYPTSTPPYSTSTVTTFPAYPPSPYPPYSPPPGTGPSIGAGQTSIISQIPNQLLSVFDRVRNFFGNLFFPKPQPIRPPDIAKIVSQKAPFAFSGLLELVSRKEMRAFVLAPLPKEFATLVRQLPRFGKTLRDVGVVRMTDLPKLVNTKLVLPGLTESAGIETSLELPGISAGGGIPSVSLLPGRFALPAGIPLANMSVKFKQQIPKEIVFARSVGEKIDFPIGLILNKQGILEKRIRTVVGSTLNLSVKPGAPTHSVKGYLVLKARLKQEELGIKAPPNTLSGNLTGRLFAAAVSIFETLSEKSISSVVPARTNVRSGGPEISAPNFGVPLQKLTASVFFSAPDFTTPVSHTTYKVDPVKAMATVSAVVEPTQKAPSKVETRFVLMEFDYTDPDGDGIYTATITTPRVYGEYEIITLISYKDPDLGTREIRLIAVVDPEGYIYEKQGDKEIRIPGAIVSLYVLNPSTKKYETWPARDYHQENPQVTDVRGTYAFLVTPGYYYIGVVAPGYGEYQGKPFEVENNEVHFNIELQPKYGWLWIIDWKTLLLVIVTFLLIFNFYRDRKRESSKPNP